MLVCSSKKFKYEKNQHQNCDFCIERLETLNWWCLNIIWQGNLLFYEVLMRRLCITKWILVVSNHNMRAISYLMKSKWDIYVSQNEYPLLQVTLVNDELEPLAQGGSIDEGEREKASLENGKVMFDIIMYDTHVLYVYMYICIYMYMYICILYIYIYICICMYYTHVCRIYTAA